MYRFQSLISVLLCLGSVHAAARMHRQDSSEHPAPGKQDLQVKIRGNGHMIGRMTSFRIYQASDGNEAMVWYGGFKSQSEAQRATKQWLRGCKITGEKQTTDKNDRVIGNLVTALRRDLKSGKKNFVLVRTYGLRYWLIRSNSLVVALGVDNLINPPLLSQ